MMFHWKTELLQMGWLPLFVGAVLAFYDDAKQHVDFVRSARLVLGASAVWWLAAVFFLVLAAGHALAPRGDRVGMSAHT